MAETIYAPCLHLIFQSLRSGLLRSAISLSVRAGVPGTASRAIAWPGLFVGLDLRWPVSTYDCETYQLRGHQAQLPFVGAGGSLHVQPACDHAVLRRSLSGREHCAGRTTSGHRTGTPQSYLRYVLELRFLKGSVLRIVISMSVENFVDYIRLPYFSLSLENLKQLALRWLKF